MEPSNHTPKIIGAVIVIGAIIGAYFFFRSPKNPIPTDTNTPGTSLIATTTTATSGVKVETVGTGNYTIVQVPANEGREPALVAPSLNRPIVFSATLSSDEKATYSQKITEVKATLQKNPNDLASWIQLGLYLKAVGDYDGAILMWKYVSEAAQSDFVSFGNLGNLYAYQLKDMVSAEKYYNQAIKNAPTQIYLYVQLAESFRDVAKDIVRAKATIDRGLIIKPNDPSLLSFKASLN